MSEVKMAHRMGKEHLAEHYIVGVPRKLVRNISDYLDGSDEGFGEFIVTAMRERLKRLKQRDSMHEQAFKGD